MSSKTYCLLNQDLYPVFFFTAKSKKEAEDKRDFIFWLKVNFGECLAVTEIDKPTNFSAIGDSFFIHYKYVKNYKKIYKENN